MHIAPSRFEQLAFNAADEVLAQLPPDLRAGAERVILNVADKPTPEMLEKTESGGGTLLGLYQGVPLIHRHSTSIILQPDRITLFRMPLAAFCRTEIELKAQLRKTIIHELGHYFGFSEEEIAERGWA